MFASSSRLSPACLLALTLLAPLNPAAADSPHLLLHERFLGPLAPGWSFEREDPACWKTGPAGLAVRIQPGNMWGGANNAKNVLVHPIPSPAEHPVEIAVTVSNRPTAQWEQANLVWYYDASHMVKLGQELVSGRLTIVMGREENDRARTIAIVPLDDYRVELRLQAFRQHIRGQFRTAPWREWRDVGLCDLPVKGDPKASLHFYNGPPQEEHWVRVNDFTVRQFPSTNVSWPRQRTSQIVSRAADQPRRPTDRLDLPAGFTLESQSASLLSAPQAQYELTLFQHNDHSYGWHWHRPASGRPEPAILGLHLDTARLAPSGPTPPPSSLNLAQIVSLSLEMDAVTRLENDQGHHNFLVRLLLEPAASLDIWFDWYGPPAQGPTLHDGHRPYVFVPTPPEEKRYQYRIQGLLGAPPQINLKPFLDDLRVRGLHPATALQRISLLNEVWDGSRGGTLITHFDVILNGHRSSSVPAPPAPSEQP